MTDLAALCANTSTDTNMGDRLLGAGVGLSAKLEV